MTMLDSYTRPVRPEAARWTAGTYRPTVDAGVLRFADLVVDTEAREVSLGGQSVELTAKEFDLLAFLATHPRRAFSRRQLLAEVWNSAPEYQDPATVTVHVGRLRNKLEPPHLDGRWFTTLRGVGYRFEP